MIFVPIQLHMFVEDEHVFVYMPATPYKLTMPYHSPYRVVRVVENGTEVKPVDKFHSTITLVALNWVHRCTEEMPNVTKECCHQVPHLAFNETCT